MQGLLVWFGGPNVKDRIHQSGAALLGTGLRLAGTAPKPWAPCLALEDVKYNFF
jgi:hypothetical protein